MSGPNPSHPAAAMSSPPASEPNAEAFLSAVRALIAKIRQAVEAIEANDLARLTASIHDQEELCAQLAMMPRPSTIVDFESSAAAEMWRAVDGRIDAALEVLRRTSLEYSLILESSSRSIELLSALCRGCSGDVHPVAAASSSGRSLPSASTWSCEV